MDSQIRKGRSHTIFISISVLLVSLHTIYLYQSVLPEVDDGKLVQQIFRFALTAFLLFMAYRGKNWARILMVVLFSLGVLTVIGSLFIIQQDSLLAYLPLAVMLIVYSMAIYHFGVSKNFKAFAEYQDAMYG
ncbi:MAG: hypothetical protein AAFQ87_11210 [Bacteroidota bacterium]